MSYDLGIWKSATPLDAQTAERVYHALSSRTTKGLPIKQAKAQIDTFYRTLTKRWPELDDIDDDDDDDCPWSCAIDRARDHLVLAMVFSWAPEVTTFVKELAA